MLGRIGQLNGKDGLSLNSEGDVCMKLYFAPGACSLSPHIVLLEAGLPFDLEQVDVRAKKTKAGGDFLQINPKGQVPTLELDDGEVLTEGPAIVQYIADKAPGSKLAPPAGTKERYRVQEWLNFIASELHKNFSPLFRPTTPEDYKLIAWENLVGRFRYLNKHLASRSYLMGDTFTVADAYLFVMINWANALQLDLTPFPSLRAFRERVLARPKVHEAMKAEGLIK
jgi:glutathione S-transferase